MQTLGRGLLSQTRRVQNHPYPKYFVVFPYPPFLPAECQIFHLFFISGSPMLSVCFILFRFLFWIIAQGLNFRWCVLFFLAGGSGTYAPTTHNAAHTLKLPFNGFLLFWNMRKLTGKMLAHQHRGLLQHFPIKKVTQLPQLLFIYFIFAAAMLQQHFRVQKKIETTSACF